jgi:hypothetical protein
MNDIIIRPEEQSAQLVGPDNHKLDVIIALMAGTPFAVGTSTVLSALATAVMHCTNSPDEAEREVRKLADTMLRAIPMLRQSKAMGQAPAGNA